MEIWILITIAAAFFQNIRSVLQKYLKGYMGTTGATFARFGYGLPFAFVYWIVLFYATGEVWPDLGDSFWLWVTLAAFAQIAAQMLLILAFSYRNFTVATAYSRTEPAQTALFALVLFGELLSFGGIIAIAVSIVGVLLISVARTEITLKSLLTSVASKPALIGLASGTIFGFAAVAYRAATLSIEHDLFFMRGATTLCAAITIQTVALLLWMALVDNSELRNVIRAWKPALMTGFVGATASFGWFSAFALQQAALVKVVAQVEMLFTFASSIFFFKESINRIEVIGCLLITFGIVLLVLL
ncbi:MAG: DMT family transporter [Pseudomonadota bacterium]